MSLRALLLPLGLLTACPEDPVEEEPPEDILASLTREGGCSDMVVYAANDDDTAALMINVNGLVEAAYAAGEATTSTFDLSVDTEVRIELYRGEYVTHATCNDAIEFEVTISETYSARAGTASFTVTPTGEEEPWGAPATAEISLTDIVLQNEDGERIEIEAFAITANVGWLPG